MDTINGSHAVAFFANHNIDIATLPSHEQILLVFKHALTADNVRRLVQSTRENVGAIRLKRFMSEYYITGGVLE